VRDVPTSEGEAAVPTNEDRAPADARERVDPALLARRLVSAAAELEPLEELAGRETRRREPLRKRPA